MEEEKKAIERALRDPLNTRYIFSKVLRVSKNDDLSEEARQIGNHSYNQRSHSEQSLEVIWQKYCLSIAVAHKGSEKLALAYANRSAFLMHLNKYREALVDIDRALNITKSHDYKFKYLSRKLKCAMHIDVLDAKKILQEAKSCFHNVSDKKGLAKLIKEGEKTVTNGKKKLNNKNNNISKSQLIKETDDFTSVTVKNNSKFGKHLIATQDIQPGEVIFIEKPYICTFNFAKTHAFCSHCLVTCWNMIPCDFCSWSLFCSEECKQESWAQYHDIECPGYGSCLRDGIDEDMLLVGLRFIVTECRKAGSISNLRDSVMSAMKKCKENPLCYFLTDGNVQSNDLKSILSLNSQVDEQVSRNLTHISLRILISLAHNTPFFGKKMSPQECKDIHLNEDVLFVGSLILKLLKINYVCGIQIANKSVFKDLMINILIPNLHKGNCISIISSLINHNCDPNASKCFTEDNRLVVYSLKPIKKNEQIFYSYVNNFSLEVKQLRQKNLHFQCNCQACKKNWQPLYFIAQDLLKTSLYGSTRIDFCQLAFKNPVEVQLYKKHEVVIQTILKTSDNFNYTEDVILDLAKSVTTATQKLTKPSILICLLTEALRIAFERVHADRLIIPACEH